MNEHDDTKFELSKLKSIIQHNTLEYLMVENLEV